IENELPSPLLALPLELSRKLVVTPARSTVTGTPVRLIPAPSSASPFQLTVSSPVFLKLSLIVAVVVPGGVIGAEFTICPSSCSVRHVPAFDGSVPRFEALFFACLVWP